MTMIAVGHLRSGDALAGTNAEVCCTRPQRSGLVFLDFRWTSVGEGLGTESLPRSDRDNHNTVTEYERYYRPDRLLEVTNR